jgi:capsular polysaccharide biosynthesis protein
VDGGSSWQVLAQVTASDDWAVQTVDLSKNMDQESFGVLDPASVGKPVNRAAKAQLLGLVMGFFLGLGLLYLLEQFDDRFSSVAELRSQLTSMGYEVMDTPEGTRWDLKR